MARAIVSGALANKPFNGGEAWVRLSWVLGLRRLGFDTYFVEEIGNGDCVDGVRPGGGFRGSVNRDYFEAVVREFGLAAGPACFAKTAVRRPGSAWTGCRGGGGARTCSSTSAGT